MLNFKKVKLPNEIKVDPRFEKLPLKNLFLVAFFISLIFLILGLFSIFILPPEIPIFYGLPKTSEQLGRSFYIILQSLVSMTLTALNAIISINIDSQHLKRTLAFTSILVCTLNIIATYKVISLVGSL